MNTYAAIDSYCKIRDEKKLSHEEMKKYFTISFSGESASYQALTAFIWDYDGVYHDPAWLGKMARKYKVVKIKSEKRKHDTTKSDQLNSDIVAMFKRLVPSDKIGKCGIAVTKGLFKGMNKKTGKVIWGQNKTDKGRLDTYFFHKFSPFEFWCDSKVKDSLTDAQKEFIERKRLQGHYCCDAHSVEEAEAHFRKYLEKINSINI